MYLRVMERNHQIFFADSGNALFSVTIFSKGNRQSRFHFSLFKCDAENIPVFDRLGFIVRSILTTLYVPTLGFEDFQRFVCRSGNNPSDTSLARRVAVCLSQTSESAAQSPYDDILLLRGHAHRQRRSGTAQGHLQSISFSGFHQEEAQAPLPPDSRA